MAKVEGPSSRTKSTSPGAAAIDAAPTGAPRARLAPGDLAGLDALQVDALVLPFFEGARQPQGVAGYADWRLSGRIGRLLQRGRFRGAAGEHLLMAGLGRVGAERVFLLGLGPAAALGADALVAAVAPLVEVVRSAGARVIALGPPVAPRGSPSSADLTAQIAAAWLEAAKGASAPFTEVLVLDADGRLAGAEDALRAAAKRGGLAFAV